MKERTDRRLIEDLAYLRSLTERLCRLEEGFWDALDCLLELVTMIPVCEIEYGAEVFTPFLSVYETYRALSERLAFYDQALVPSAAVTNKLRDIMIRENR